MAEPIIMYCGHCGNKTGFQIRGKSVLDKSAEVEYEDGPYKGEKEKLITDITEWRLLQCMTCSNVSLEYTHKKIDHTNDWIDSYGIEREDSSYVEKILYPSSYPNLPNLPPAIEKEYQEALKVRNISPIACAVVARRTLEAVFTHENAQGDSLIRKIENLITSDRIPPLFAEMAHLARKIGNLGAHFADETVTAEDVAVVLDFVEAILEYLYVIPAKVETVKNRLGKLPNS